MTAPLVDDPPEVGEDGEVAEADPEPCIFCDSYACTCDDQYERWKESRWR